MFNDIPRVGTYFYDIPGSGRILRHTRVGAQFNDIPGSRKRDECRVCIVKEMNVVYVL